MRSVLEAAADPSLAAMQRPRTGWTATEIVEHVVIFEERYLDWILHGSDPAPPRDPDRELRLFSRIRSRLNRLEAPDVFHPSGRFESLAAAIAGFRTARNRTIAEVSERGERIYSIGIEHPYFGSVNGGELVQLIDGHARRHADQLRELTESLACASSSRRSG